MMDEDLLSRLKVFIYDLLKFNTERLYYSIKYPQYYFSRFYFTEDEIEYLLYYKMVDLKCKDLFDNINKDIICTSHDIAPLLYKHFNIKKGFENEAKFKLFMRDFRGLI